jgi:hypothetical protein
MSPLDELVAFAEELWAALELATNELELPVSPPAPPAPPMPMVSPLEQAKADGMKQTANAGRMNTRTSESFKQDMARPPYTWVATT